MELRNGLRNEIKVSVIVPVYNVEQYLVECIESLLSQTLKEIEIILVDDGSTDASGKICDQYACHHGNVQVIHKENAGLGSARNAGVQCAKGTYVYFIDSDDWLDKNALQYLHNEAEKKQLDVVLFSAESFGDDRDVIFDEEQYKRTVFLNEVESGERIFKEIYLSREYYASIPLRFYNRNFFLDKEYIFPKIIHEDEFVGFVSLIQAKKAECIPNRFYKRRYRKGSIMTSKKAFQSAWGYVYTCQEMARYLHRTNCENEVLYCVFLQDLLKLIIHMYANCFTKCEKRSFRKVRKKLAKILKENGIAVDKGIKVFLKSPVIYFYYKKIIRVISVWRKNDRNASEK